MVTKISTKIANWQPTYEKNKKKGKTWKIYWSLDELSMNYPLVNVSDTSISYVTIWYHNEIASAFLPWMQLWKELYTIADYLHFPSNENINIFSSAFLFQKFWMVFVIVWIETDM